MKKDEKKPTVFDDVNSENEVQYGNTVKKKSPLDNLVLAAIFLAIAFVLSIGQIPIVPNQGLTLDFAFVAVLIARRYTGLGYALALSLIYPWFTLLNPIGGGAIPGVIFLMLQGVPLVLLDYLLVKDESIVKDIFGILIVIVIITLWSLIINIFIICPMWQGKDWVNGGFNYGNGFDSWYTNFFSNPDVKMWTILTSLFNPLKFLSVFVIMYPLYKCLKKVL